MDVMRVRLPNDMAEVRRLNDAAARFLWTAKTPTETIHDVQLVLEEVVTNVIRHGWPEGGSHTISVEVALGSGDVRLRVEDDGREFDATSTPEAPLGETLDERRPGGLGLRIVRRTATSVRYQRLDGRNVLELTIGSST